MARYIKVNPKVAQYLHLENDRNRVKDGNYLLWQADILPFGRLTELPQILERIGGIALLATEARQEQDGTVMRELPEAADEEFKTEKPSDEPATGQTEGDSVGNGDAGGAADENETDNEGENTEKPADGSEEQPESKTTKND